MVLGRKQNPTTTDNFGTPEGPAPGQSERHPAVVEPVRPRDWLFAVALVVAVFVVYRPAWHGAFIWDNDTHLLNNPVLAPGGVFRTWVPGTYVNYWPLTFTVYRVEYQLWGLAPLGFHLVNIALHAVSAILIWRVLALLRVPGALLAAALFALHPANVESVAWITQLKNVLSLVLTLVSVLLYLLSERRGGRWGFVSPVLSPASRSRLPGGTLGCATDPTAPSPASRSRLPGGTLGCAADPTAPSPARQAGPTQSSPARQAGATWLLAAAVAVFALATLAKGMTLTLPVVLLACAWWQRGRIAARDLWRVLPFLLIGLAMVCMEVLQQHAVAGQTVVRSDGLLSRTAVAGCAVWFYLWKLVWPVDLIFVYPRWNLAAVSAVWFAPGLLLAAILALAWRWRDTWGRPLLMLIVCYVALLLPVLGFVNIYFMEYSLVADHWQYAAMIVPCAAAAGAVATARSRWRWCRLAGAVLCPALLAALAVLTWRQSSMYADIERLCQTTIDRNPKCWMAEICLGVASVHRGQINEGIAHYQRALEIKPDCTEACNNLGVALGGCGRIDEAIARYRQALQIKPEYAEAHNNLGTTLARRGQIGQAIAHFKRAVEIKPSYAEAHLNLGSALTACGQMGEAIAHFQWALAIKPDYAEAHNSLGAALAAGGRTDEAIAHLRTALRIRPKYAEAQYVLGTISAGQGRTNEAIAHYQEALKIKPEYADAQVNLGTALATCGRIDEAVEHYQKALEIRPDYAEAHINLGTALLNQGRRDEALEHYRRALALATRQGKASMVESLSARLRSYEAGTPPGHPQQPSDH